MSEVARLIFRFSGARYATHRVIFLTLQAGRSGKAAVKVSSADVVAEQKRPRSGSVIVFPDPEFRAGQIVLRAN